MYKYICIFLTVFAIGSSSLSAQDFDTRLLHSINQQQCMHGFSSVISESTIYLAAGIPVAMGITALATKNDALFKETLCYGVSLGLSIGLSYGLKYIVNDTYNHRVFRCHFTYTHVPQMVCSCPLLYLGRQRRLFPHEHWRTLSL